MTRFRQVEFNISKINEYIENVQIMLDRQNQPIPDDIVYLNENYFTSHPDERYFNEYPKEINDFLVRAKKQLEAARDYLVLLHGLETELMKQNKVLEKEKAIRKD